MVRLRAGRLSRGTGVAPAIVFTKGAFFNDSEQTVALSKPGETPPSREWRDHLTAGRRASELL